MATATMPVKTSWADDVDEFDQARDDEGWDANGIKTVVEYSTNEEGKKIKITRRIKRTLIKHSVDPVVAARKTWAKFGDDKGKPSGPDRATTTVGENVGLKLMAGGQKQEPEPDQEEVIKKQLEGKKIMCRICKGSHFTTKCPYRDTLGGAMDTPDEGSGSGPAPRDEPAAPAATGGKYVPPSMRAGATNRAGETMGRPGGNRDDLPTLRVTNVSEDAEEQDLRDLFSKFGRVSRVYIGKDRETGIGKGYAFVSFEDKQSAENALEKGHGRGYDNLILNVQWSQPREQRPGGA